MNENGLVLVFIREPGESLWKTPYWDLFRREYGGKPASQFLSSAENLVQFVRSSGCPYANLVVFLSPNDGQSHSADDLYLLSLQQEATSVGLSCRVIAPS